MFSASPSQSKAGHSSFEKVGVMSSLAKEQGEEAATCPAQCFVWVMCTLSEQMIKEIKKGGRRCHSGNSQLREVEGLLSSRKHLAKSGDICGCHMGERALYWHVRRPVP